MRQTHPEPRSASDPPVAPTTTAPATAKGPSFLRPVPLALTLFAGALLLVGLATGSSRDESATGPTLRATPLSVTVLDAVPEPGYTLRRELVGRVEARRSSEVGFELEGRLASVAVDEGARVRTGETLATLDTERLEARRRELEARLEQANAALDLARSTLARVAEARQLDAISSQELDEAETAVRARRAEADHARAALERIDVELAKSRLAAPFDAVVIARRADEGQVIVAGQPVLALLEHRAPEARIALPGDLAETLVAGGRYTLDVAGRQVRGTLRSVLPVRRRGTRSADALFELEGSLGGPGTVEDGSGPAVMSGELARLGLERTVETPGFWLPISALTESSRGLWALYVVVPEGSDPTSPSVFGHLERRPVEVLHQQPDRAFVHGAIGAGERFVADGLHRLAPGQRVRITSTAESGRPAAEPSHEGSTS